MNFLSPFGMEDRTSSGESTLSDGSYASSASSAAPRIKCKVVPNEQATYGRMSEAGGVYAPLTFSLPFNHGYDCASPGLATTLMYPSALSENSACPEFMA